MAYDLRTARGYDFFQVSSAFQKAIRRGDKISAGFFGLELFASNYAKYVWKRLYTISAEDIYSAVTSEIDALYTGFNLINDKKSEDGKMKGRIFISKAIILLCECEKSRESDHIQCLSYDKGILVDTDRINEYLSDLEGIEDIPIPDYAHDVHTLIGKRKGMTKKQFFIDEHNALTNRQISLFDEVINDKNLNI